MQDVALSQQFLVSLSWKAFNADTVMKAPTQQGVYFIARRQPDEILYVGCSDEGENLRARLTAHLNGSSNIRQVMEDYRKAHPNVELQFACLPFYGASDPRAAEDFYLDLLGGCDRVPWNRKATARRVRNRIMNYQTLAACPCCGRAW